MPSNQPTILQSPQPASAAVAAAAAAVTITSEFIHASLVVAATESHHPSNIESDGASNTRCTTDYAMQSSINNNAKRSRATACVSEPKMSRSSLATLEYSVHLSPRRMTRDLATVFPNMDLSNLLVVPTFQKCHYDMVSWDTEIAKEKDDRLEDVRIDFNCFQGSSSISCRDASKHDAKAVGIQQCCLPSAQGIGKGKGWGSERDGAMIGA